MGVYLGSHGVNLLGGQPQGGGTVNNQDKSVTPTESQQTVTADSGYTGLGTVTVGAIDSEYVGSDITRRSSTDLGANGATVTAPSGYYGSSASKTVASGSVTAPASISGSSATVSTGTNTLTLSKTVSVTPSVTTAGYISSGTAGNSSVSLTASVTTQGAQTIYPSTSDQTITSSKYLTGTQTFKAVTTTNLTADNIKSGVTVQIGDSSDSDRVASVTGTYSGGGGGSSVQIGYDAVEVETASSSITFTGLRGEPTSFNILSNSDLATGASPFKVAAVVYDGTDVHGQTITNTNNAQVTYDGSSFSYTYNNGDLTVTSTGAYFQPNTYLISYSYDGTAGNVKTADVQVGSGATSITFTGIEDEPLLWSVIFKSNFSTSSGYQRVVWVSDWDGICGHEMDSSAHFSSHWTYSYNNGTVTVTSQGTNQGGYFHQPGHYQLTYVIADASPYEKKSATYRASTSAQTDKIEPSSGYDAMSEVNITIPAVTQTNLTADNIKSGTTVSISNGQSNLWSITGTYGGGGSSKNVQISQSTNRTTANTLSKANGDLTVSKTGTYDVYWTATRSATSSQYTWGSQLYIGGSGYGTENTSWSNHVQNNHLSNVSLTADQKIAVYTRGRSGSYYVYAPLLVIVEA